MSSIIADTQSVIWYLMGSKKLSLTALNALQTATEANAPIYVSVMTLIEITYLLERERIPIAAETRLQKAIQSPDSAIEIAVVDQLVVDALRQIPVIEIPEMPDRIIAATAKALGVPLVTSDRKIRASSVSTIW